MPDYSDVLDKVAAASICPDCSVLAFASRSTVVKCDYSDWWEFMCPRCGMEFATPESELVFRSLPKEWLSTNVYRA